MCIMFHKIANMYHDLNHEEQDPPLLPFEGAEKNEDGTVKGHTHKRFDIKNDEARHSVQDLMQIPKDLLEIQPQNTQVWNCDEVGFDPNSK